MTIVPSGSCPSCASPVDVLLTMPEAPTHWVRVGRVQSGELKWGVSRAPPGLGEYASPLAYRCPACGDTTRVVFVGP